MTAWYVAVLFFIRVMLYSFNLEWVRNQAFLLLVHDCVRWGLVRGCWAC